DCGAKPAGIVGVDQARSAVDADLSFAPFPDQTKNGGVVSALARVLGLLDRAFADPLATAKSGEPRLPTSVIGRAARVMQPQGLVDVADVPFPRIREAHDRLDETAAP